MSFYNTPYFNFTAVREQAPSINDWAATYWNWISADRILYGLLDHVHDGAPALDDPTGNLTLTALTSGGSLLAGKTYYFVATYIDAVGLETGISAEANVTMGAGLDPPTAPTNNDSATPTDVQEHSPGGLLGGSYWYKLAYIKGGGETLPSSALYVEVPTDTTYEVKLHFESINDAGNSADAIRIYRKYGSGGVFNKIIDINVDTGDADTDEYIDDNTATYTNCSINPKTTNTTNSLNSVTIDCSTLEGWEDAVSVRVYASLSSLTYNAVNSLVGEIDLTDATPGMEITWTGSSLTSGKPPAVSQTYPSPGKIDLTNEVENELPWENMPVDMNWYPAADSYVDLTAIEGVIDGEIRLVTDDMYLYSWLGATPSWTQITGDILTKQEAIADEEPATPSLESTNSKINAILAALRSAGVIEE